MERLKEQKADQKRLSPGTSFGDRSLQRFRLHRAGPQGAALFFDPEMSFSRPRDLSILFSAAACLFFDL